MRNNCSDCLQLCIAGGSLVHQQGVLPEGDEAPVLHGTHREAGKAHQVQLGQAVGEAKELIEDLDTFDGSLNCKDSLLCAVCRAVDRHPGGADHPAGGGVLADHQAEQVGRHAGS